MIVIGVGSKAQQGKSLFCATIAEQCSRNGAKCVEYSISGEILNHCIREGILPTDARRETVDPNVLVEAGTWGRAQSKTYWTDKLRARIDAERPAVALIPNVRFPTEQEMVKQFGGFNVRVTRLNPNGSRFISTDRSPNDDCETSLDLAVWDFEIVNHTGRGYWLRRQAIALFEYLREGAE